jgi:hypothetical protein
MRLLKRLLIGASLTIAAVVGVALTIAIVIVGGYALYVWLVHPDSFAVPFSS